MRISEAWLRAWIDPPATTQDIAERLVMAGLELEIEPAVTQAAHGVVVGHITAVEPHPDAERLRVCQVDVGDGTARTIVCGAPNARVGLRVPCALPGAVLPGDVRIGVGKLRGVESAGMLCSAKELALAERSDGLLELDGTAPVGAPIGRYLGLDDRILHLELTPNRGDCLSVLGLAREIASLYDLPLRVEDSPAAAQSSAELVIESGADTSAFLAQRVTGIDAQARTPDWMRERLRRSGLRSIHPLVDITNYVMLELGQPLHAYDAAHIELPLTARRARAGERVQLLNEQWIELSDELVIADARGPVGLAGAMGGLASSVSAQTRDVLFESAAFSMDAVAGVGRRHRFSSDALYRFERGVDPQGQRRALARAVELTLQICGGEAGVPQRAAAAERQASPIRMRESRLASLIGMPFSPDEIAALFRRLHIDAQRAEDGVWTASAPSWRHDLAIEPDLIEELARLYGYDRLPARPYAAQLAPVPSDEAQRPIAALRRTLIARGWQEIVSLAFAAPPTQRMLDPDGQAIALDNPIADTHGELRTTLWSGLCAAWRYNRARQSERAWLFETGVCFSRLDGEIVERERIAGLLGGDAWPEQWAAPRRPVDFFDAKGEVEALLAHVPGALAFVAARHPALHPGRSARIMLSGEPMGWLGELHPEIARQLDVAEGCLLFELDARAACAGALPRMQPISELPSSRRDVALIVPESVTAAALVAAVRAAAEALLRHVWVFDVYRGENLADSSKSMTLGLIFQDASRTLTVEEVDSVTRRIVEVVKQQTGASER